MAVDVKPKQKRYLVRSFEGYMNLEDFLNEQVGQYEPVMMSETNHGIVVIMQRVNPGAAMNKTFLVQ